MVDTFLAAVRDGDFDALVALLDPDIVVRSDGGTLRPGGLVRGAAAVAGGAIFAARFAEVSRPALVNGAAGVVVTADGRPVSVLAFTIVRGTIVSIVILSDPERLDRLDLTVMEG
ncbi:nuclear transport factor 2 family protein [Streptomyces panacea]|uniref:nuclear transport factor 2 family protein n=1 Tax=Streptomyces panacea TaxID=3035064 RepID=UPI00339BF7F0